VSLVGGALVLLGATGTVVCVRRSSGSSRPLAVLAALGAPISLLLALIGGVLCFVPGFLR
jgi:hypothetical protein